MFIVKRQNHCLLKSFISDERVCMQPAIDEISYIFLLFCIQVQGTSLYQQIKCFYSSPVSDYFLVLRQILKFVKIFLAVLQLIPSRRPAQNYIYHVYLFYSIVFLSNHCNQTFFLCFRYSSAFLLGVASVVLFAISQSKLMSIGLGGVRFLQLLGQINLHSVEQLFQMNRKSYNLNTIQRIKSLSKNSYIFLSSINAVDTNILQQITNESIHTGCFSNLIILFNAILIIKGDKMINGLNISQIRTVSKAHANHFKRLNQIVSQDHSSISSLDKELVKIVHNRKYNHDRWRKFQQNRKVTQLNKDNATHRSKINKIKMGKSNYGFQSNSSFSHSVAHNFYNRKKLEIKLDEENPEIAKRLIQIQSSMSTTKANLDYDKMHSIMLRLEKFPVIQRLSSFSHKTKPLKTEGDSPKQSKFQIRHYSIPKRRPLATQI